MPVPQLGLALGSVSKWETRLISRLHTFYDWRRPLTPVTMLLMEFGDYAMMRRMLCGIKERVETGAPQPHQLHRPIPTRDRRIQTPTTPAFVQSRSSCGRPEMRRGGNQRS
jgi:hypothetical protein